MDGNNHDDGLNKSDYYNTSAEYAPVDEDLDDVAKSTYYNTSAEYAPIDEDKEESGNDGGKGGDNTSTVDTNSLEKSQTSKKDDANVTVRSTSNAREGNTTQKVRSFYDEDHYALPDEEGDTSNTHTTTIVKTPSSKERIKKMESGFCCERKCSLSFLAILLLAAGVGGAIFFTIHHKTNESGKSIY